mgnify:CR=1 FL=1
MKEASYPSLINRNQDKQGLALEKPLFLSNRCIEIDVKYLVNYVELRKVDIHAVIW